jgi:hypothetical protein
MMRVVLIIISALCGLLMIGGLVGYSYEDSIEDVVVPPLGQVGFADDPLTESALPSSLINAELTITWSEEDVWVGLVTEDEYERCQPSNGMSQTCMGTDTVTYAAGGPNSLESKSFTYEISGDVYYPVDGGPSFDPDGTTMDVEFTVHVTLAWPVITVLGLLGTGLLVIAQRI